MHRAVADGRLEVVKFLIAYGADVNVANKDGKTLLQLAEGAEMKKLLMESGAEE